MVTWAEGQATDAVTGGRVDGLRSWRGVNHTPGWDDHSVLGPVLACLREIEEQFVFGGVEIEFGLDPAGQLVLFQVRELDTTSVIPADAFHGALERAAAAAEKTRIRDDRILGSGVLLGAMTDWNPAELIGLRPTPLAWSLYDCVITSAAWCERRAEYGYMDMRGVSLMVDLAGHAFIDVRASLTSLTPGSLEPGVAGRLVHAYVERLREKPTLHDKVEFEVAVTCMAFDTSERLSAYVGRGLEQEDVGQIESALRALTDRLCCPKLIAGEVLLLEQLPLSRDEANGLPPLQRALRLWNDARSFGAVPFGGIARCSFVATQILRSATAAGLISDDDLRVFFGSLSLPSARMSGDLLCMPRAQFLSRYGHLRPGTYDIRSARYDEAFDRYFATPPPVVGGSASYADAGEASGSSGLMSPTAKAALERGLQSLGLARGASAFLSAAKLSIEWREWAKLAFTRNISDGLQAVTHWGLANGFITDELACLTCEDIERASHLCVADASSFLRGRISASKLKTDANRGIDLPVLIRSVEECFASETIEGQPNFVTRGRVIARVADVNAGDDPAGAIVALRNADPGYDWIFAQGVVGLITAFGGANSHMTVRALEAGIPAAIGCGPMSYERLIGFRVVELDAGARSIRGVA